MKNTTCLSGMVVFYISLGRRFLHKNHFWGVSTSKKKSVHISRAGVYIKPLLVQCANAAIKDKSCPYFYHRYQAIKKRRGHKKAIIAIARMLLTCTYNMLLKNETFDNSRYDRYLTSDNSGKSNHPTASIDIAILYLQSQGFAVTKLMQGNGSP